MAPTASHEQPSNVLGALVFFSYIIAALSLTGLLIYDLITLYKSHPKGGRQQHRTKPTGASSRVSIPSFSCLRLSISVFLAFLSFATLSYHMLFFLIDSYVTYCNAHLIPLPNESREVARSILSPTSTPNPLYIWTWATHSTLFQDFAYSILSKPACWWWTEKALLLSFVWNCFMALKGSKHAIPHLWAYFFLDQILPVSFTQNLFFIAMQLTSNTAKTELSYDRAALWYYITCLFAAPSTIGTRWFFPVLFATRALLFAPYLLFRPSKRPPASTTAREEDPSDGSLVFIIVSALIVTVMKSLFFTSMPPLASLTENHAVSALGFDFLIGIGSLVVHWLPV